MPGADELRVDESSEKESQEKTSTEAAIGSIKLTLELGGATADSSNSGADVTTSEELLSVVVGASVVVSNGTERITLDKGSIEGSADIRALMGGSEVEVEVVDGVVVEVDVVDDFVVEVDVVDDVVVEVEGITFWGLIVGGLAYSSKTSIGWTKGGLAN